MRAAVQIVALLAVGLAACSLDSAEPAAAPQAEAQLAATDPVAPPIVKAPPFQETLAACRFESVNFADLRAFADRGEFARLDEMLGKMRAAYRETPACESHLVSTFGYLRGLDFELLDRWTGAAPDSWAAFTARGAHWVDTGYARRGTRLAKDVTAAQWAGMREAFDRATADLMRALELDPDWFVAYGYAIYLLKASSGRGEISQWHDALVARDPYNYSVRVDTIEALSPWWGGSLEAARAVALDAQRFADHNPRLRMLPGFVEAMAGDVAVRARRYPEAVAQYQKALAYGDYGDWHYGLAINLSRTEDWNALLQATDQWLAALGESSNARVWRGRALEELGNLTEALADYDRAIAISPQYSYALQLRGVARRKAGRISEAAADLRKGLEHSYAPWALNHLSEIAAADPDGIAETESLARRLVEKNPNDPRSWFLLSTVLHARAAPEARGALERYVALAGKDGDEWARVAKARRLLDPGPQSSGSRLLPALSHLGLAPATS